MDILSAVTTCATSDIEAAGLLWRCRRIRSSELYEVGAGMLAIVPGGDPSALASNPATVTPNAARQLGEMQESIVCAGLIAGSADGGVEWGILKIVPRPEQADAKTRRVYVGDLPSGVVDACFHEIMKLTTDGGAAAERLASFRQAAGAPSDAGRARP